MYLLINDAVGDQGTWVHRQFIEFPAHMQIDYARIYASTATTNLRHGSAFTFTATAGASCVSLSAPARGDASLSSRCQRRDHRYFSSAVTVSGGMALALNGGGTAARIRLRQQFADLQLHGHRRAEHVGSGAGVAHDRLNSATIRDGTTAMPH